jgi:predicted DNA-binding protein
MTTTPPTHRVGAPPVSSKQLSIRINPELRAQLDYLTERTGLKDAQVIRMAITRLGELEQALGDAALKPARTKR